MMSHWQFSSTHIDYEGEGVQKIMPGGDGTGYSLSIKALCFGNKNAKR